MSCVYKFVSHTENINGSTNDYNTIIWGTSKFEITFTIYDETQIMQHLWRTTLMTDEVSGEVRTNARVKYDIIFNNEKNGFINYGIQKINVKDRKYYEIKNAWAGESLEIFKDGSAIYMVFGSGMRYISIFRGFIQKL